MLVHRDRLANAAVLQVQGKRIVLKAGAVEPWTQLDFELAAPWFLPKKTVTGICRFYLQEVSPNFRLYVSPININPADPAVPISEPASFISEIAGRLGPVLHRRVPGGPQRPQEQRVRSMMNISSKRIWCWKSG